MPYFDILLQGDGISISSADEPATIVGFYTTRRVRAGDLEAACERARELVLADWQPSGRYAHRNAGSLPKLIIESAEQTSFFVAILSRKASGYSFFGEEDD